MKCKLDRATVHYTTRGKGQPIIMLHGGGLDRRSMIRCMEPVLRKRKGWKRIYLDLPGMGKTPAEKWISNSDQMLEIISDFIEEVISDQRFVLVGDSYGGYLARGIIYHESERVDGLLLTCPMIVADPEKRTLPQLATLVKEAYPTTNDYREETDFFESFAVVQTPGTWKRTLEEVFSGFKVRDVAFWKRLQTHGYPFTFDVDALREPFKKPTLIIVGRQDSMVGYRDPLSILENYSRATFAILDRAGHNLKIEQEHLFNALVEEWLERVAESTRASQI